MPVPEVVPSTITISDKWTHFLMYGFLSTMVAIDLLARKTESYNLQKLKQTISRKKLKLAFDLKKIWLYPTLWGVLMECFQGATTYRSFSIGDMIANLIGTSLASITIYTLLRIKK